MKTLNVYSYDITGKLPKFRDLELWEIERDNIGLLGMQNPTNDDFDLVSPDCILDYLTFQQFSIFRGDIWTYTIDEIKEFCKNR